MCTHHWDIAPNTGLTSLGVCRYCDEKKLFPNDYTYTRYNRNQNLAQLLEDRAVMKKVKKEILPASWSLKL